MSNTRFHTTWYREDKIPDRTIPYRTVPYHTTDTPNTDYRYNTEDIIYRISIFRIPLPRTPLIITVLYYLQAANPDRRCGLGARAFCFAFAFLVCLGLLFLFFFVCLSNFPAIFFLVLFAVFLGGSVVQYCATYFCNDQQCCTLACLTMLCKSLFSASRRSCSRSTASLSNKACRWQCKEDTGGEGSNCPDTNGKRYSPTKNQLMGYWILTGSGRRKKVKNTPADFVTSL